MSTPFLGSVAWQYIKPEGQIYENQSAKVVELWPAGFSQKFVRPMKEIPGAAEQVNRQEFYKELFEEAESLETEENLFPFAQYEYKVDLVPEPKNRYDPFALKIELSTPEDSYWNEYHIGYIPAKINQIVLGSIERISDIQILSVTNNHNDKFYCARFAIGYDGTILNEIENKTMLRFKSL